jgi:hypothetical protein
MKSLLSACLARHKRRARGAHRLGTTRIASDLVEPSRPTGNPYIHPTKGNLTEGVAILKAAGFQTIIIDTPPTPSKPLRSRLRLGSPLGWRRRGQYQPT